MDLLIIDNAVLVEKYSVILTQFEKSIYEPAFPDRDEREDFDEILRRTKIGYGTYCPKTIILLGLNGDTVVGGEVVDLYEECQALEIIYLAVQSDFRGNGYGKTIAIDYTSEFLSLLDKMRGVKIKNVYFETNNPLLTSSKKDSYDPTARLRIFSRLGAKWIDIDYVQPALSPNRKETKNLFLMTFPQWGNSQYVQSSSLKNFLIAFYKGLGQPETNLSLCNMMRQIEEITDSKGAVVLKDLPLYENESNECEFENAIVTVHYTTNLNRHQMPFGAVCPYFHSYETDLMNYSHQKNIPMGSSFHSRINNVSLVYPDVYHYESEGCLHRVCADKKRREVSVDISISCSYNKLTDDVIVHLTLCPSEGAWFTEHDLIKLTAIYGSIQERYISSSPLMLRVQGTDVVSFETFLCNYLIPADYKSFGTGITQLELQASRYRNEKLDINRFFDTFDTKTMMKFDNTTESFSAILCGIILGIFDFKRMTDEEIHDTIRPMVCRDNSFVVMCRGNLVRLECAAEREKVDHIIVSPYLLVPSSVLVFNELVLQKGNEIADQKLSMPRCNGGLSRAIEELKKMLYTDYLVDIFQYRSEKEIVEAGNSQRGLHRLFRQLEQSVELLVSRVNNQKSSRANFIDSVQSALLLCLTLTQIKGVFYVVLPENNPDLWFFCGLLVIFVCGVMVGRLRQ
ncbi:MAG: GNAT family N-acetyltransferase [Alistipes sp.]|nr:GNAT family N-acetyltransferase [Alistipes sp.]